MSIPLKALRVIRLALAWQCLLIRVSDKVSQTRASTGRSSMEERVLYGVPLDAITTHVKLDADIVLSRAQLVDLKRQLVSLLVTVERALSEEPSEVTRAERRRG